MSAALPYGRYNQDWIIMPSKSFAVASVVFGIVWGTFFYPPGPKPGKARIAAQQIAQVR